MKREILYLLDLIGKNKQDKPNNKGIVEVVMLQPLFLCSKIDYEFFIMLMKIFQFNMLLIVHFIIKDVMEVIPSQSVNLLMMFISFLNDVNKLRILTDIVDNQIVSQKILILSILFQIIGMQVDLMVIVMKSL